MSNPTKENPRLAVQVGDGLVTTNVAEGEFRFQLTRPAAIAYATLLLEAVEDPRLGFSTEQIPT